MPDSVDIARGGRNARGLDSWRAYGRNQSVGTDTDPETVWDYSGAALWVPPTQARVHNVASSSANDDGTPYATGSGAHYVWVDGISANGDRVRERVALNGTASVATKFEYTMINDLTSHREYGSSLAQNAGEIAATAVTDNTITRSIAADMGSGLAAVFQVPRDHTCWITRVFGSMCSANATGGADLSLYVMAHRSYVCHLVYSEALSGGGASASGATPETLWEAGQLSYIKLDVTASADNTQVFAGFDMTLRLDVGMKTYSVAEIGQNHRQFTQEIISK